jgi:hypothetical protein
MGTMRDGWVCDHGEAIGAFGLRIINDGFYGITVAADRCRGH